MVSSAARVRLSTGSHHIDLKYFDKHASLRPNERVSRSGKATERQDQHVLLIQAVPEESEELRLSLCRLVGRMLNHLMGKGTIGVLRPYFDDTVLLLAAQCRDSYSAVKEEALVMITKLALHPHLEQVRTCGVRGVSTMCTKIESHTETDM